MKENTFKQSATKYQAEQKHFFQFPGVCGFQGGTQTIMLNVPARTLARVLSRDSQGHALERSQREINNTRVKKFINYLTDAAKKGTPFIVPALIGNCDSDIEFEPIGNTMAGIVRIPMDAKIKLFDGQHRASGIIEFIENYDITLSVPILLTEKLSLDVRKQFFSDINNNASKPSATINMAYNGRDEIAQTMVNILQNHEVFSSTTDFEHNVVPAKKPFFISFKAVCDATKKFIGSGDNKLSSENIEAIWQSWIYLTGLDDIRHGTKQHEYKKDYIQFHGVMINAFGYAVADLLKDNDVNKVVSLIETLSMSTDNWQKEKYFLIENWTGVCVDASKDNPVIIANVQGQRSAAMRLISLIKNGSFE
ncbi:DGQHR domain-containing protein [Salmonella enterica]|nr:DGQHR domain-containing protein [Salmonella enterica]